MKRPAPVTYIVAMTFVLLCDIYLLFAAADWTMRIVEAIGACCVAGLVVIALRSRKQLRDPAPGR